MGWPMLTLSILTMAVIIVGIWLVSKALLSSSSDKDSKALEMLKTRYAKGEITAEEYYRIKRELL